MKKFFSDFKQFISKGKVFDLAVGVVLGASFSAITNSLVNDIIMPPIGVAIGGVDFKELSVTIKPAVVDELGVVVKEAVTWNYGNFIQTVINFFIIALFLFIFIRLVYKIQSAVNARLEDMRCLAKASKNEVITTMKKENKSKKEIKNAIKQMKQELKRKEKEEIEKANARKKIIDAGTNKDIVLLDIRNLLIKQLEMQGVDSKDVLQADSNKYFDLLKTEQSVQNN